MIMIVVAVMIVTFAIFIVVVFVVFHQERQLSGDEDIAQR